MVNDDRGDPAGPRPGSPGTPEEAEAVEEFETVPQVAAGDPGVAPAPPPSAVESFDRPAPPPAAPPPPATPPAGVAQAPTPAAAAVPPPPEPATRCPRCGTENQPGVAFCRNCGQRLVAAGAATVQRPGAPAGMQTCPSCGTVNRLGVAFCQNCGAGLREAVDTATAPMATPAYVPPAVGVPPPVDARARARPQRALLGPIVLIIGAVGLAVGWGLPFAYGGTSLFERALGTDGYGVAFWDAYPDVGNALNDQAYFGFAAPVPALVFLLALLALGGFVRGRPGWLQVIGLVIAFIWAAGLGTLFVIVEVLGADAGAFTALLRSLSAAGIIFLLSSIVVVIGVLTRFARS